MVGISSLGSRVGVDQICRDCELEISRILLMVGSHVRVEFRDEILMGGGGGGGGGGNVKPRKIQILG